MRPSLAGRVGAACMASRPPLFAHTDRGTTDAQKKGLAYERKVHQQLTERFPVTYKASPWIRYRCHEGGWKYCQPDGLLHLDDRLVIVEVKLSHCVDAWEQLRKIYEPVISKIYEKPIALLEVAKWYDPLVLVPEPPQMCYWAEKAEVDKYNVLVWNGRGGIDG